MTEEIAALRAENAELQRERDEAQQREQWFRALGEAIPHLVWMTRPDGFRDYFNERWYAYTGTTLAQTQGEGWLHLLHPDDRERTISRWMEALRTGEPYEIEYRFRRASDGAYRWFLGRAAPVRGESGEILKWVGTCTDIEEQKAREREQQFLSRAGAVLSSSLDLTITLENLARLVVPHLADWCAVDLMEGDAIRRLAVAHADPEKIELAWELNRRKPPAITDPNGVGHVIATGETEHVPVISEELLSQLVTDPELLAVLRPLSLRSALIVPLLARSRPIGALTLVYAESGRVYSAADRAFAEEIAQRASLAVENARLYREAEESSQYRQDLLTFLSQDLKSPLSSVINDVGASLRALPIKGQDRERLENIQKNTERMQSLLHGFLDLEQIRSGTVSLDRQQNDPLALTLEAVEVNSPLINEKGITLLRETAPRLSIYCDRRRIMQMLSRILAHAVRVTPPGGRIVLRVVPSDGGVRLGITDGGPRLAKEVRESLNARRVPSGDRDAFGLTLAIARLIVEAHQGRMWFEEDASGNTFFFTFPVAAK